MHFTRPLLIILALLSTTGVLAKPSGPIQVLVIHWYDRAYSSNDDFDRALQAALQASEPEGVEYYSEYLETNRFPGDEQALVLAEFLREKYAGRKLDVVISGVNPVLEFLIKYRYDLFPSVPLVFANDRPVPEDVHSAAGATGFTYGNTYAKTLDLALKFHPRTKQLFVVSGTLNHDKALESIVRDDLWPYESAVAITYLTDLAPDELTARIRTLPKDSLIFYVWQQVLDPQGRLLEAPDVLARVAHEAKVPIYGRSHAMIGRGIVGGYVWTQEGNAAKLADITMRVVNGTLPSHVSVERGPETPMFDWRELQRWGIDEDRLPPGSIMRFREPTIWQQYKWRIVGAIAVVMLQTVLIGALLLLRERAQRRAVALVEAKRVVQESEERFRRVFEEGPLGLALVGKDYRFSKVNNALCQMVGYDEAALVQMSFVDITHPDDLRPDAELAERLFAGEIPFYTLRKRYVKKNGEIIWINLTASVIRNQQGEPIYGLAMIADITERKRAEDSLRESRQRLASIYDAVEDAIFHLAFEPEGQFRIVSVNAAFLRFTGLSQERVVGKTVNEVIPEPSLTTVLGKYREAIEEETIVCWEETSDYPAGRLTGEVTVAPIFDNKGTCTQLVGSVHDITERKRAQEIERRLASDLEHSRDEIRALVANLMRAQEDERRRVSRELHDQICYQLASVAIDMDEAAVSPLPLENLRAQIAAIRERVVKTSREAHDIAYQMNIAIVDDLGLVASLKHLCSQFSERYPNIAVDFKDSGPPAVIPREMQSCVYRVAQESLQNIAKHSRAECVSVRVDYRKRAVVLRIQDDGAGFDPQAVKGRGGLGLISMRERAHSVNGKLTINARLGHGTQIALEIPLATRR